MKRLYLGVLVAVACIFIMTGCKKSQEGAPVKGKGPSQETAAAVGQQAPSNEGQMSVNGAAGYSGEELFKAHCAKCHPGGKNIVNPDKSLFSESLRKNGITTPANIVALMRNPGPGMQQFNEEEIPDSEANKIAEYVLNAF